MSTTERLDLGPYGSMIENGKIAYAIPDLDVSPTVEVVVTQISPNEVRRNDLDLAANLGCDVVTATQTRANQTSKLVKVTRKHISTNATLMTETPYEVSAHLVLRFDERYATLEQKEQVIGALINFLMEKSDNTNRNVIRIAKGEL